MEDELDWEPIKIGTAGRVFIPRRYLEKHKFQEGDIALMALKKVKIEAEKEKR